MELKKDVYYTSTHEWVEKIDEHHVRVGITDFAQRELGDIVYVDVPQVGIALKRDASFGTIEAIKTVSDLYMPIDGTVVEANNSLADAPEQVNQDPYDKGWIVKIKMADEKQLSTLLSHADYKQLIG